MNCQLVNWPWRRCEGRGLLIFGSLNRIRDSRSFNFHVLCWSILFLFHSIKLFFFKIIFSVVFAKRSFASVLIDVFLKILLKQLLRRLVIHIVRKKCINWFFSYNYSARTKIQVNLMFSQPRAINFVLCYPRAQRRIHDLPAEPAGEDWATRDS